MPSKFKDSLRARTLFPPKEVDSHTFDEEAVQDSDQVLEGQVLEDPRGPVRKDRRQLRVVVRAGFPLQRIVDFGLKSLFSGK